MSPFAKNATEPNNNHPSFTFLISKFVYLVKHITFYIYLHKITFCFKIYFNISLFYSIFHSWLQFLHNYPPPIFAFYSYMIGVRSFMQKNSLVPSCLRWNASWRTQRRIVYKKTMISFFLNVSFPRIRREVPSHARR